MEIFIGIDQSINSTGVTVQQFEGNQKVNEHFYIITKNKFTKKELKAQEELINFDYIGYNKREKQDAKSNNDFELNKLFNNIDITNHIIDIIKSYVKNDLDKLYVGLEGVSYSSSQTKSLLDLSALSSLIRYKIYKYFSNNKDHFGGLNILTPGEVKKFASGNGNASKDIMVSLFSNLYPKLKVIPKIDDIADSYWICSYIRNLYLENNGICNL